MRFQNLFTLFLLFAFAVTYAQAKPPTPSSSVAVEGILMVGEFIGPPNYGESPESDRIEQSYFLQLPAPLVEQLHGDSNLSAFTPEARTTYFVQLVAFDSAQTNANKFIGKKVKAVGTLFESVTGHHRTPILIEAHSLSKITKWKW